MEVLFSVWWYPSIFLLLLFCVHSFCEMPHFRNSVFSRLDDCCITIAAHHTEGKTVAERRQFVVHDCGP